MPEQFFSELDVVLKISLALVCGVILGLERELAGKPAGLRTYSLVAIAGAMLTYLGVEVVEYFAFLLPDRNAVSDPTRVIHAIIVGISFLGAGTIIKDKSQGEVENLSTAAGLLVTAGIGIGIMLDKVYLAGMVTVLVLFVNRGLHLVKKWAASKN
jgi:putative Mg2+ transporter-C (MgtC) family protein